MNIPQGWERTEISQCANFIGGSQPPQSTFAFEPLPDHVRLLQIRDYKSDRYATYIPRRLANRWCEEDDIMVGRYGPPIFQILRGKQGAYNVALIKAEPSKKVARQFLYFLLKQGPLYRLIDRLSPRTSGQTGIDMDALKSYPVPLPPLPEQRKIADILTTWDEALTQLDALIEAQERRKKALMQQLLTGKKRFPAFAKKPWKKVRMGEVLKHVFRPIDWSAEMSLSLVSLRRRCGGLFRRPDVLGADYKTQDLHELHADDFLISKRQVAHGAWGLVTPEFAGSHVSKEYAILVNAAPQKLHMPFFAWLCQIPRMIRLSRVASTGVHIEKLIFDPEVFLRDSIRIPSDLEEQRQIVAILDTAAQQLTLLRDQRTALDQQKRGLMQRLLTGKLRVNTK